MMGFRNCEIKDLAKELKVLYSLAFERVLFEKRYHDSFQKIIVEYLEPIIISLIFPIFALEVYLPAPPKLLYFFKERKLVFPHLDVVTALHPITYRAVLLVRWIEENRKASFAIG